MFWYLSDTILEAFLPFSKIFSLFSKQSCFGCSGYLPYMSVSDSGSHQSRFCLVLWDNSYILKGKTAHKKIDGETLIFLSLTFKFFFLMRNFEDSVFSSNPAREKMKSLKSPEMGYDPLLTGIWHEQLSWRSSCWFKEELRRPDK